MLPLEMHSSPQNSSSDEGPLHDCPAHDLTLFLKQCREVHSLHSPQGDHLGEYVVGTCAVVCLETGVVVGLEVVGFILVGFVVVVGSGGVVIGSGAVVCSGVVVVGSGVLGLGVVVEVI